MRSACHQDRAVVAYGYRIGSLAGVPAGRWRAKTPVCTGEVSLKMAEQAIAADWWTAYQLYDGTMR